MRALILSALLLASGCVETIHAESTAGTSNGTVKVDKLFVHEGCAVYRFYGMGYARYYVTCADGSLSALGGHTEYCGKGCSRYVADDSVTVPR